MQQFFSIRSVLVCLLYCTGVILGTPEILLHAQKHKIQSKSEATMKNFIEFKITNQYLNLPVKNGAPLKRARFQVDGKLIDEFEIELPEAGPDFFVFIDLSRYSGKTGRLEISDLPEQSHALELISPSDEIAGAENLYRERLRPQFHFSSRRGWLNDPNGLVWFDGEYHLFYQHNPYGWKWGNMHWGHAVSPDLVHWRELPIAIYPHRFNDWVFSGSAVIDWQNSAGFQTGDDPALLAAFTSTGRGEVIAFSNNRGRTFTEFSGNPVVEHVGRDPKVIWHARTQRWVMAVYHEENAEKWIAFYSSPDLKRWTYHSQIAGFFECPELFEISLDGCTPKWVIYAADGAYRVGQFDGQTFAPETEKIQYSFGDCFYASQTFNNIPESDGRRIQIGWGRVDTPGMPFNQCMLFPCELSLRSTTAGPRLFANPVREIELLHGQRFFRQEVFISAGLLTELVGELWHARIDFDVRQVSEFSLVIQGTPLRWVSPQNGADGQLKYGEISSDIAPENHHIHLEILVDCTTVEVFANHGRWYVPLRKICNENAIPLQLRGRGKIESLEIFAVDSVWE